jgi:hypothetical protein
LARLRRDHGPDCCVDEHAIDLECGPSLQTLPPLLHLRVQLSDGTVAGRVQAKSIERSSVVSDRISTCSPVDEFSITTRVFSTPHGEPCP